MEKENENKHDDSWTVERHTTVGDVVEEIEGVIDGPIIDEVIDILNILMNTEACYPDRLWRVIDALNKKYPKREPEAAVDRRPIPTESVEINDQANDLSSLKPTDLPSKKPEKPSKNTLAARERIRMAWVGFYEARYGFQPSQNDSAFIRTQIKKIHLALGEEAAVQALNAYLSWDNPMIVKQAHPLYRLLPSLDSLRADLTNPEAKYSALARGRAQERVLTEEQQRMEEIKAYERRDRVSTPNDGNRALSRGDSEQGSWAVQDPSEE